MRMTWRVLLLLLALAGCGGGSAAAPSPVRRVVIGADVVPIEDRFEVPGVGTVSTVTPLVIVYEAEDPPAEVRVHYKANRVPLPPGATRYVVDPVKGLSVEVRQ